MLESRYQAYLIKKLRAMFPGCVILKNDPEYLQGMLDLILLYGRHWALLEVKGSADAPVQPNQGYYVALLDEMSFAAFIYPEIEEVVLDALQLAFKADWVSRLPES